MSNAKTDATFRVTLFHTKTKGRRFVAMAWNYEEAMIFSTGDHATYGEARAELDTMAEVLNVRLRWFDGEWEHTGPGDMLVPRSPTAKDEVLRDNE